MNKALSILAIGLVCSLGALPWIAAYSSVKVISSAHSASSYPMPNPADSYEKRTEKFLAGLSKLTREHGIVVDGCGCCGSPWLIALDNTKKGRGFRYTVGKDGEYLCWNDEVSQ